MHRLALACGVLAVLLCPRLGIAEAQRDRFTAGGYFRIMTRPDLDGGNSKLGFWNVTGRLLNEGPWGMLDLKLDLLQQTPGTNEIWTSVHAKIEGGSFANSDSLKGFLSNYRLTKMSVEAGNILIPNVTWELGTLWSSPGDLGLYDMRLGDLFYDTLGLSGRYNIDRLELLLGVGDAGYFLLGDKYNTVLTAGGWARLRLGFAEVGVGGQYYYEPQVTGNKNAPYQTLRLDNYERFYRGEVLEGFANEDPQAWAADPNVFLKADPRSADSFKLIGYFGFGKLGPLRWSNFYINYLRKHPEHTRTETRDGNEHELYVIEQTDERYELNLGNEMQIALWPEKLDAVWSVLYGRHRDYDNTLFSGEDNREFYSTVLRLQYYIVPSVHLLVENAISREVSLNGNLYREHDYSPFKGNTDPETGLFIADRDRGYENGDIDHRDTWQIKAGIVLNPLGPGIYTRPSLRILYGGQRSNVQNAFSHNFPDTQDQHDLFKSETPIDRHWHHVIAIEAEAWF